MSKQFNIVVLLILLLVALSQLLLAKQIRQNQQTETDDYQAEVSTIVETSCDRKCEIKNLINTYADKYNVSAFYIKRTIECETHFRNTQSNIIRNGERELSFGLAQIHLPSHPHITKEQALDEEFAIAFMAEQFSKGRHWQWFAYDRETDTCTHGYQAIARTVDN